MGGTTPPTTFDSLYSVQAPFNSPSTIGLRYTEILKNTITVPQVTEDSISGGQIASILVRNAETFERDTANEACSRKGCIAPTACYLQRRNEQSDHILLYHYLKCFEVVPPKKNLLSRSRK